MVDASIIIKLLNNFYEVIKIFHSEFLSNRAVLGIYLCMMVVIIVIF